MISRRSLAQFDYLLLVLVVGLSLLGVLGVYSAFALKAGNQLYLNQLARVGIGLGLCLLVFYFDYHLFVDHASILYWMVLVLLVCVLVVGTEIHGSRSWLEIAGFRFQPSELGKIALILMLTRYLAELNDSFLDSRQLLAVAGICCAPVVLIILQGDLGTASMYLPIAGGMAFVAGIRGKVLITFLVLGLLIMPVGWLTLKDYQKQRVLVTFDPSLDPQGFGYQTRQSQIAIGSGGFWGRGLGNGLQSKLGFVPESHTDFIFALLAEETGFLGAAFILMLYLMMLMRLVATASRARDRTGILIITGITCMLASHIFVNVGMVLGLVPPIGIPLPLLSYGGSSLLISFMAVGLALNVGLRRFVYS